MAKKKHLIEPVSVKALVRQLSKEKDLEPEVVKHAVEAAILSAAQRRAKAFNEARPELNIDTGEMKIFVRKKVVINVDDEKHEIDIISAKKQNPNHMLGQEVEVEIDPEEFGRIAAQSVRQGILQRLRDAERDRIYEDYKDKVGSVVTGVVQRYDRRDAIVSIGRIEALLPASEIPMGIRYRANDRIRCLIVEVRRPPKGAQVILSRTRVDLVKQLFATEVPEISDGTVRIVEIAREPGVRTKIAVQSLDSNVDPVGACVGMKGSRVQMIVRELDNEKIDIVPYSPIPENFITSALNPAQIIQIRLHQVEKRAEVIVERESLSKAIGKRGQNAKLAAKLTGWKIDISEQEEAETLERLRQINIQYLEDFLSQLDNLPEFIRAAIAKSSEFNSVEKIAESAPKDLLVFTSDSLELAEEVVAGAQEYLEGLREMTSSDDAPIELSEEDRNLLLKAEDLANRLAGRTVSVAPDDPGGGTLTAEMASPPPVDVPTETDDQPPAPEAETVDLPAPNAVEEPAGEEHHAPETTEESEKPTDA